MKTSCFTPAFATLWQEGHRYGENRDCAIRAVSILTGEPYGKVRAIMGANGRRPRCGVHDLTIFKTLTSLGFEAKGWTVSQLIAKHDLVPKPIKVLRLGYLQDYLEIWGDQSLMVFTRGHVANL